MTTEDILNRVLDDAKGDICAAMDALKDPDYLAKIGADDQKAIEDAYSELEGMYNYLCELDAAANGINLQFDE